MPLGAGVTDCCLRDEDEDLEEEDLGMERRRSSRRLKMIWRSTLRTMRMEHEEDENVLASVHEVGESSTAPILREGSDGLLLGLMRRDINSLFGRMASLSRRLCGREMAHALVEKKGKVKDEYYGKLILELGNEVRSSVEQGTAAMEKLIEKPCNAEEKSECKKLKKELEEARFSNIFLRMQNERVERDLYWTRVRAHEFYQEMIRRGFCLKKDRMKLSMFRLKMIRVHHLSREDLLVILSSLVSIVESVDAAIAAERARQANVSNDASGSGPVRGRDTAPAVCECTFAGFMKFLLLPFVGLKELSNCEGGSRKLRVTCFTGGKTKVQPWGGLETMNQMPWTEMKQLMTAEFCLIEEIQRMEHELWNLKIKEYDIVAYTQRFNELALMCPRMVEPERVKVDAYIRGLTDNIKGEVTSSKPADLNEAVRMAHKLMEQKSQARNERILEGKKRKWENLQGGNSSGKGNQKDNSRQTLQNNQKQGNARAMVTAPTDGKLPLCERCFTRHVGQCTIKCHKCGKVGHKARYCREKSVATGANAQPIWTCYDCGEQGHTRNRCPKKVKQEEVGEVRGRAYAIKDAEPKGLNVVTEDSYEVELADGRVVSTNTVLKGCTLSLVNHIFEIDLMPIELGKFDVIIGMDWLVKHDVIIVCGDKVVRISYGNKTLIVKVDKGGSRLKIISCIKARKYVEQGCHLFLAHVTKKNSKEK
ncbi:putative reverse transcriptase domain-containing protein [Tanacetum coccineum]